jgi:hypothetical protein
MGNPNFDYEEVQAYMHAEIASTEKLLEEMTAAISDDDKDPAVGPVSDRDTHEWF